MKFTNGFWQTRPEITPSYVREMYKADKLDNSLCIYAPFQKINGRGNTLNTGMLTIKLSSPCENVISVKLTGFKGGVNNNPQFSVLRSTENSTLVDANNKSVDSTELTGTNNTCPQKTVSIDVNKNKYSFTTGKLSACVECGKPELTFLADGKVLTRTPAKGMSKMQNTNGHNYLVTELSLDVGETVYGFGERFTPYVKNGQTVDMWNEDGGTASEIAYKNIPFYSTSKNYGVFVNHPGCVSFEVGSEKVESVQFSVEDEELEYFIIYGENPQQIISRYTLLTGRPPVLPKWSFGLWLSTSFTTNYDEKTVTSFIDGMEERNIPLSVFHFDCFWMKEFEWCNFDWDKDMFPDPKGMLKRLHQKNLKICVWINPYIAQKSPLFEEGMNNGYLLKKTDGSVWQTDLWQAGMGIVDFTNPQATVWYQSKLRALLDIGVDCFKTDFGERIPTDVAWFNGGKCERMHNYYTYLYNKCVYDLLVEQKGEREAVLFARSATAGCQQFPLHWGGDSTSQFVSMAETLRGGLSLMDSGFAFWSHDIGGFEDNGSANLYKRWVAFGLLSSHSRLHGSTSYRVPWNYDDESSKVCAFFTKLKCSLMPYIYTMAIKAHQTGIPVIRPMHMEFPNDPNCAYLDRQYMFGDSILVAPVFSESGEQSVYLPEGVWTHLLSGKKVTGSKWFTDTYDFFSLPLFVRENSIIPFGSKDDTPDYDFTSGITYKVYELKGEASFSILDATTSNPDGVVVASAVASNATTKVLSGKGVIEFVGE